MIACSVLNAFSSSHSLLGSVDLSDKAYRHDFGGSRTKGAGAGSNVLTEDLSRLREFASFLSRPAVGESSLFVTGYDVVSGKASPVVGDVVRFRSVYPQDRWD